MFYVVISGKLPVLVTAYKDKALRAAKAVADMRDLHPAADGSEGNYYSANPVLGEFPGIHIQEMELETFRYEGELEW